METRMRLMFRITSAVLVLTLGTACQTPWDKEKDKLDEQNRNTLILILLAAAYYSNPCNTTGIPSLASAQAAGGMNGAGGSLRGKILTASSTGAVSALVIAESNAGVGTTFFSTHSSIDRDGTFFIAGIPASASPVKIAVEPIYSDYYNRIDTHIDCFISPRSFTSGWSRGNGATTTTTRASGSNFTITNGAVTDAGTIVVN